MSRARNLSRRSSFWRARPDCRCRSAWRSRRRRRSLAANSISSFQPMRLSTTRRSSTCFSIRKTSSRFQAKTLSMTGRLQPCDCSLTRHRSSASAAHPRYGIRCERILRYNELDLPRKLEADHADTLTLLVAQGLGWAITTPTCLLQTGTRFVDVIDLIPIDKGNSVRSIYLVGRRGEFPTLSKTIADAVKQSLLVLVDSH